MNAFQQTLAGAGAQIALNSISATADYANSKKQAERQHQYNKELMKYQGDLQQEYIDKQNQYNSPVEQMKRLQEAGLNPNLAYGEISSGQQQSAPKPQSSAPANYQQVGDFSKLTQYVDVVAKFAQLQDTINKTKISNEQVKQIQAQTNLTDTNVGALQWKMEHMYPLYQEGEILKNKSLGWDVQYRNELYGNYLKDLVHADMQKRIADSKYIVDKAEMQRQDLLYYYLHGDFGKPRHLQQWELEQQKEKQALSNMEAQNDILGLQQTSLDLSNEFTRWYNKYRKAYRQNLYTPGGAFGWYGNKLERITSAFGDF